MMTLAGRYKPRWVLTACPRDRGASWGFGSLPLIHGCGCPHYVQMKRAVAFLMKRVTSCHVHQGVGLSAWDQAKIQTGLEAPLTTLASVRFPLFLSYTKVFGPFIKVGPRLYKGYGVSGAKQPCGPRKDFDALRRAAYVLLFDCRIHCS